MSNLNDLAESFLRRGGDRSELVFEGNVILGSTLEDHAARAGAALSSFGVNKGDRVAVMMANAPEVQVSYSAIWRAGGVVTPIMFLVPPEEARKLLQSVDAKVIITTPELASNVAEACKDVPSIERIISTGEVDGTTNFDELLAHAPGQPVAVDGSDIGCVLFTGGTTGSAKGVTLTHDALVIGAEAAYRAANVADNERTIDVLPLSHGYGMVNILATYYVNGPGLRYLLKWFEPTMWLQGVQEHRIRRASLVPTMIQMLLSASLEDYDLSSLQQINSGAAPLAPDVIGEFEKRVPSCKIYEGYGCSESGIVGTVNRVGNRKIGSVGLPMPYYEIKIFGEDDVELPANEPGEVVIRSQANMSGYWKDDELTAETLRNGWLHTGDIGKIDEDGFLYILDRKKDLIIRGGFNVFPRDVEDALLEHPAVEVAGVVGRPDPVYGEEVIAFVSLRGSNQATPEELVEHCKSRIGRHKYPREVRIVGYVPLTPVGKVDRKALRQMI